MSKNHLEQKRLKHLGSELDKIAGRTVAHTTINLAKSQCTLVFTDGSRIMFAVTPDSNPPKLQFQMEVMYESSGVFV